MLANTFSCYKQDTGPQEAIGQAYQTQALLTLGQLDLRITQELLTQLASITDACAVLTDARAAPTDARAAPTDAPSVLIDRHTPVGLLNQILAANKHSYSLKDEQAKAVKGDLG